MNPNKKMFFSLEGVDLNDDAALEAFAQQVWERFMEAQGRQKSGTQPPEEPPSP